MPLPLSPRITGLTRWIELLHDGVIELSPFPHSAEGLASTSKSKDGSGEEPPQGLLKIHRLPVLADRGTGVRPAEDDWAFTLSRRRLMVKEWRLGPVDDDGGGAEHGEGGGSAGEGSKKGMEF